MLQKIYVRDITLFQDTSLQSFTLDSILLEDFIKINRKSKKMLEIGTGNGIVSLLLAKRCEAKIDAVEILKESYEIAKKNVEYNKIDNIELFNIDIKEFKKDSYDEYDTIFSNPPYFKVSDVATQMKASKNMMVARNECMLSLEEVISISSKLLKNNGHLYLVFRVERMIEIIELVRKYKMSVKHIKMVYTTLKKEAQIVLFDIIKSQSEYVHIDKPIVVYDENGKTEYIKGLY